MQMKRKCNNYKEGKKSCFRILLRYNNSSVSETLVEQGDIQCGIPQNFPVLSTMGINVNRNIQI